MAVQINVAANQAALTASIQAGVQAYNQRFAQNNPINLSINQRAFSQPLGRMTGDVKDFEAALAASNARVIAFGASTAVLGGVIRSFKELANVTIDVEKNLADINRVFGLTTSQLQKFSTDLFSVGKQTASSFDDASKAALEFSRQGLKAEEVLIRTKDALTLARVAGISTANSVDALTSTINGFAATGVTTTQILNKLVAVEQDFAVGAGDLAEALSRTGQAAQEAGVSLDQLNALVTAAQQSTARGGAVIGNALKTIFTRLQRTETLDQLEAFNIAVRDVQGNTLPAVTVLQNFAGAYKNLGDAQRAQLSEQVAGVYQVNILKAIVGDLNKSQGVYAGALQRGASATNEAEIATAKLNQTLDALLKQTATSTQQLANNIGKVTFEPLARYGTEQLKSLVESMNEILEGEGVGSTFANGLLKGIRNVIAGPGAIAAFFTLFKLIQNSFTYLAQALPQIAGITTETQNRKNIEQSILQIMQQQGPVSQALAGTMGNQAAQAQLLLQLARQQTAEYQMQSTLAKQLATQLAGQGVRVKGSGGLQVTRAGGYIPAATRMAETVGAQAGGYAPGKVVKSPVGGVMNTAEDVKYVPGFAQPFINPPAGSKAGRTHRQNAISRTGVDPYIFSGFIPNFVNKKDRISLNKEIGRNFENKVGADIGMSPSFNKAIDFASVPKVPSDPLKEYNKNFYSSQTFADAYSGTGHNAATNIGKVIRHLNLNYNKILRNPYSDDYFFSEKDLILDPNFTEIIGKGADQQIAVATSKVSSLSPDSKSIFLQGLNKKQQVKALNQKIVMEFAKDKVYASGFIPNFAPPTSAMRVPWFKKFGNAAFDNIQPTLGISKANDLDTFRQINFRTNAKGADKVGDSNIFAPLYEDFVFKAMQLVSQSKVKDQLIRGYALQPGTDQKQSAFDAFLGDTALEYKGFPKANITGSISKTLNDKYERFAKVNPAGAAKIKESVITFNELGHENQLPSEFGKTFSQLAGTSYSQMAKSSPDLTKALSAETNMLLGRYVKNPDFLPMAAAKGFVPNFAYKQAVMGLEESMSGEKAVFDTKPFPHIRNKSQPTFSSAIADHGGLGNALSDSMRGQKNAGLMSKGYVPNFAAPQNNRDFDVVRFSSLISKSVDDFGKKLSFKIGTVKENILLGLSLMNQNFDPQKIERTAESTAKKIVSSISNAGNILTNSTKTSFADLSKKIESPEFKQKISNLGTTLAFAGPMAAGLLEQSVFGNRKRTDMSATERQVQSGLSTGLTAASTGASIGSAFGPLGAGIGLAAGAAIGLAQSLGAASLSADELAQVADEYKSKTQENISSAQNYIDTLKTLNTSTDPEIIRKASDSLAENFANIKDVNLQEIFKQTGTDVKKLGDVLTQYEKDRKKMQNETEEDFRAAQAGQAKSSKDLAKLGYTKAKTIKGPGLASDFTFLEFKKETDDKILSDYKETFSDLSSLSDQQVEEFSKLISQQKASGYFDKDAVSTFLKKEGMSEGMAEMLTERFDTLEDTSNIIGNYLIDNLIRLFNKNKQKIETAAVDKSIEDKLNNDFIKFRNELTERLSDNLIAATNAVKNFEFKTSMVNLVSNKLKEINDSIFSSISGNLTELGGILVKTSQLESGRQFQQSQLATLRQQTQRSTSLKNVEARASYLKQSRETIFSSGGVSRSPESAQRITDFLSTSLNKTRKDFQNFASSLSLSDGEAKNLAVSLEENQRAFREKLNDSKNELLLKQQEFDLNELNNKINYQIGLEQFKLETEKLKITYAQRDATLQLRKDVESYKITSARDLELKKINIGGEFRYLGSGKRETFASQQTDQKSIFDDEQKIAQKQAILDARKSIIEIATQEANINAQNANTEAILNLVDAITQDKINQGFGIMSNASASEEIKRGKTIYDQGMQSEVRNSELRTAFNKRKNTLSYNKLSDLGVTNEMSIEQAMAKLNDSKVGKDQSTVNAIDNTIQDLKTASETLGSSATVYAAKVAQAKADFEQSAGFVNNMAIGFKSLGKEADDMVDQLGRNLPGMFADGLVDGIKAAIRESDNLGTALMGIASKFLDEISTTLMKAGVRNILSGVGFGDLIGGMTGNQTGGYIRAQSGMYISGTGTGDKYPAMLENGEYVLNRRAVMAMGGPAALDTLNFSAAPRFASGGAFKKEFNDISSMEANMTEMGLENSPYYNELNDAAKQKAAEDRAKKLEAKKQKAAMIGSLVAAAATIAIGAGISNIASNAQATKAQSMSNNLTGKGANPLMMSGKEFSQLQKFQSKGLITSGGSYIGGNSFTGFKSMLSKPTYGETWYQKTGSALSKPFGRRQTGGLIGSRLSDTIPGYMEGGLYDSPMVKRYGTGMQSGGSPISSAGNSNSTVNNNTSANNSFNFNTSVQRDGSLKMGSNTTSYEQQDVELSKNLNNKIYAAVGEVIRKEKQFGGSLAGARNS
jgi:TP901 family phage tail tape measure protein